MPTRTVEIAHRRLTAALLLAGVSLLVPSAARASLEWTSQPYQRVSQAQTNGDLPRVGADAAGKAVLAWREADGGKDRIRVATRTPGGYFTTVAFPAGGFASAAGTDANKPRVAVAPDGSAMVVWDRLIQTNPTVIRAVEGVYRSQLGAWGPVETIATGGGPIGGDVAIDAQGNVTVAWIEDYSI